MLTDFLYVCSKDISTYLTCGRSDKRSTKFINFFMKTSNQACSLTGIDAFASFLCSSEEKHRYSSP